MYIRKALKDCMDHIGSVLLVDDRTHSVIAGYISRDEAIAQYGDWIVECGYTDGFTNDPVYKFKTTLWIYPARG